MGKKEVKAKQGDGECIFCKIGRGEIPCRKVLENDNFIVFYDVNPRTKGHCLIVPKKHFKTILDMPSSLYGEFLETAKEAAFKLLKEHRAEGFNLVLNNFEVAGQVVGHVHMHLMPRYKDDGFKLCVG